MSFSVFNFVLFCFLETASVIPLSSQITIKRNDLYIVSTSIFLIFSEQGSGLPVSRPMMLLHFSALIMHVSKNNLF